MRNKLLFCNTGWMDFYDGLTEYDKPVNGGAYIADNGVGGEIYNFHEFEGRYYGYVQPPNNTKTDEDSKININCLGAKTRDSYIENIDVLLTATSPGGGTFIVGYYKDATVFREKQLNPHNSLSDIHQIPYGYRITSLAKNVKLLQTEERTIRIPRAGGLHGIKGGFGQSNIWYARDLHDEVFFNRVHNLLDGRRSPPLRGNTGRPDRLVEVSAVKVVTKHFEDKLFKVENVEKLNYGWDLEATSGDLKLLLEVKGLSGESINAGLTPNEFRAMNSEDTKYQYHLCVVTNALAAEPSLSVFKFNIPTQTWINQSNQALRIKPITSAIVSV